MKLFSKFALASEACAVNARSGLGFGCMGITAFYGAAMPDDKAIELLRTVYDAGVCHFDTAEVYASNGKYNEDVLGKFFQTVPRDSFSVATKYWPKLEGEMYEYETVKEHLLASLKRLQLEYVDVYYAHRVTSLAGGINFAKTANRLKDEGLIKEVGLSEVSGKWLDEIYTKGGPVDVVQQEWSIITRNLVEDELVPVCKKYDVTIVAYSPLARNMLAKKIESPPSDWRATLPRYAKENLETNNKIVEKVQDIATKYNGTAAQLSLAWLFHKAKELGVSVVPIPGSTKIQNVKDNIGSVRINIGDVDSTELEELANHVVGERGDEGYTAIGIESQQ